MRVVIAHKNWRVASGADRYAFELARTLEAHGNAVVPFSMHDPANVVSEWSRFFVSPVETSRVRFTLGALKTVGRALWSFEAAQKFGALLDTAKPDIVHLQNIYRQISPSILPQAKKRGIPVVMTANDYALVAPNYSLFHNGAICERTKPDHFWRAVGHRCMKGSLAASAAVAAEMSLHRMLGVWKTVDRIIAPSRFVAALLAAYGIPQEKIVHIPYPTDASLWTPSYGTGEYALFVGRLVEEKGVATLIRAAVQHKDIPLHIIGTGPEEARLKALAQVLGATNVVFRGFLSGDALRQAYSAARFIVVPSEWYEVSGLVALEAYAAGKPVIASQIGGLAENVRDGETGLQISTGDIDDLSASMAELWSDPVRCATMGRAGREWVENDFTPEKHYARVMEVYSGV